MTTAKFLYQFLSRLAPGLAPSIQKRLNPEGLSYLAQHLSLAEFGERLRERHLASLLLPPFCNKAQIELLIADDDLEHVADLVTKWPGGPSIKLYSVSGGRREFRFDPPQFGRDANYSVSLFPPPLAESLLGRALAGPTGANELGPTDTFLSCAYRAAYLYSDCWEHTGSGWIASADCDAQLRRVADRAGIVLETPITPGALDRLLESHGWRPSIDLLERTANWMPWIQDLLTVDEDERPGFTVFFIRSRAVESGFQPKILECLRQSGFEPLTIVELAEDQVHKAAQEFRGGNWSRGPYRVSGGPPATICVALDLLPVEVSARDRANFPESDNHRIMHAKTAARDMINAGVPKADHYNPVHSTDNARQAWRAVRALVPDQEADLRQKAEQLRRDFATGDVIRDLTKHGRRAKVELIEFDGELAIRKTFRPSALEYMHREIEVMKRLAPLSREIPRLLASGENYIVMEYVGGGAMPPPKRREGTAPKPLPLRHVRKLAQLITTSVSNGFDPIDLRADGNVIYSPSGLKLIDFEYWRPCDPKMPAEKSMCLSGIPMDDAGERPLAPRRNADPYRIGWYPYTMLSCRSFLYDSPWLQRLKRSANIVRAYGTWSSRAFLRNVKRGAKGGVRRTVNGALAVVIPHRTQTAASRSSAGHLGC